MGGRGSCVQPLSGFGCAVRELRGGSAAVGRAGRVRPVVVLQPLRWLCWSPDSDSGYHDCQLSPERGFGWLCAGCACARASCGLQLCQGRQIGSRCGRARCGPRRVAFDLLAGKGIFNYPYHVSERLLRCSNGTLPYRVT